MNFVEIVLDLINKNGITKNKMLTDLKLGKNSFVNWIERGTIPNGETLSKISEYFNVSTDYLLGTEQKEKAPSQLSERANRILEAVNRLSEEEQEAFLLILEKKEKK